jgi:hypothetical protein
MSTGYEKGIYPLCREEDDVIYTILKCSETRSRRKKFSIKWLPVNEGVPVAYKRIIDCTNAIESRNKLKCWYYIKAVDSNNSVLGGHSLPYN